MSRNFTDVVNSFKSFIRSLNAKIELSEGTFTNDIVISPPAKEFENLYSRVEQVALEQSISTASDVGLDSIGSNFSKIRKAARRAQGLFTFFKNVAPTIDLVIQAGTTVSTLVSDTTQPVTFRTTQTVTMYSGLALSYYNPNTNKYEINIPIEAVNGGDNGNVGAGTIVVISTPIPGIDGGYNAFVTSGGLNTETGQQFANRLSTVLAGLNIGTTAGYKSFILDQNNVDDVLIVSGEATGRSDYGAVDIYVKGEVFRNFSEEFSATTSPYPDFVFSKQPIITTVTPNVISSVSGVLPLISWQINKDSGNYAGSILAQDSLHWNTAIGTASGSVIVTYQYNGLIEDLQSSLGTTNEDVINSNTLIKWATEIPIDVTASIRLISGFTSSDVITIVENTIANFFSTYAIGQTIQQSELIAVIQDTAGVDDVSVPFTLFQSHDDSILPDANGNLQIPVSSYATAGNITINLF